MSDIPNAELDQEEEVWFSAPSGRLLVKREGHSILRSARVPKPTVIVDTRERYALPLHKCHRNWIQGSIRKTLRTGDYSIEGMEDVLTLERKTLPDIVACTVANRARFIRCCYRLAEFRWKAILIEATYEDLKRGWMGTELEEQTWVHPNAVCGTLDAIEAKFGIPIIYTSRRRELATERAASWLSKHFTYWWLETNGHGRLLIDLDKL